MTDAQYQEAFAAYKQKLGVIMDDPTNKVLYGLKARIKRHMESGLPFNFGPKGDELYVVFVKQGKNNYDLLAISSDGIRVKLYDWCMFGYQPWIDGTMDGLVTQIVSDMLDMVAVWDITMKQYFIDLARAVEREI